jgi:hypothetical protein
MGNLVKPGLWKISKEVKTYKLIRKKIAHFPIQNLLKI